MTVETRHHATGGNHVVHFYEQDSDLARVVGRHLADGVLAGEVAIIIASPAHRRAVASELVAAGVDLDDATVRGTLVMLDAAATLSAFTLDGQINADAFHDVVGGVVASACESGRPVRAYGEMVAILWDDGDVLGAIELEMLWNDLALDHEFSLLCGYHSAAVSAPEQAEAVRRVCHLHSSVLKAPRPGRTPGAEPSAVELSREFAARPDAPGAARHFVADALRRWGHDGVIVNDAQLLVSELATNAVLHARTRFSVIARLKPTGVWLAVSDGCAATPSVRVPGRAALSGRGLALVAAIATDWGVESAQTGKIVWADLQV